MYINAQKKEENPLENLFLYYRKKWGYSILKCYVPTSYLLLFILLKIIKNYTFFLKKHTENAKKTVYNTNIFNGIKHVKEENV